MTTSMSTAVRSDLGVSTIAVIDAVQALWPEHEKFLKISFANRSPELLKTTEIIANLLTQIADANGQSLAKYAHDYRYLCEKIVYPEEVYFRRTGEYRLKTFKEADNLVYANEEVMSQYMNGLFVSDALWLNHASAMNDFARTYLPTTTRGGNHLEIGPGHGMLLHLAIRFGQFQSYSAWDVSATSIAHAGRVLDVLGISDRVDLQLQNMYALDALRENRGRFDTIILSEVLEHLEEPQKALEIIRELLTDTGTVWINVPANGPAPDHLFLVKTPREAEDIVRASGLTIVRTAGYPLAGSSLERAIRQSLPISCVLVAKRNG